VAAFLAQLDRMPKTVETYRVNLRPLTAWMETEGIAANELTTRDAKRYKAHLAATYKATTVNAYLTAARRLYAWIEAETGYTNPLRGVEGVRGTGKAKESKAHDALSHDQIRAIANYEGEGAEGLRNMAMQNLMLTCGLRTIEVSRANVGDYRQDGEIRYLVVQGKGHAEADVPVRVEDHTAGLIDEYLATRGRLDDDAPLFAGVGNRNRGGRMSTKSISRICRQTMEACGIRNRRLTAHSYRHTAITESIKSGADLLQAQTFARHENPKTTLIYVHGIERMSGRYEQAMAAIITA
jgi:site-specific recombinase XerD